MKKINSIENIIRSIFMFIIGEFFILQFLIFIGFICLTQRSIFHTFVILIYNCIVYFIFLIYSLVAFLLHKFIHFKISKKYFIYSLIISTSIILLSFVIL